MKSAALLLEELKDWIKNEYITKPIETDKLIGLIEELYYVTYREAYGQSELDEDEDVE